MSPRHRSKHRRHRIDYAESVVDHLKRLGAHDRAIVIDAIEEQLSFAPSTQTRNRKRMEENSLGADFELRIRMFRVYYEIDADAHVVSVLAVGYKIRNRVVIGGEEIDL